MVSLKLGRYTFQNIIYEEYAEDDWEWLRKYRTRNMETIHLLGGTEMIVFCCETETFMILEIATERSWCQIKKYALSNFKEKIVHASKHVLSRLKI